MTDDMDLPEDENGAESENDFQQGMTDEGELSDQDLADIAEVTKVESDNGDFDNDFYRNLAEELPETMRLALESSIRDLVEQDEEDNDLAVKKYEEALKRTGLGGGDSAPGGAAFEGASKAVHPLISEAAIDFQSSTVKELLPPAGPVKVKYDDDQTAERIAKANRVEKKLNHQFTEECVEYIPNMERMLSQLPLNGDQYIKVWWNPRYKRPWFEFVPSDMIYIPATANDFYTADRFTHRQDITDVEFQSRVNAGLYMDIGVTDYPTMMDETSAEMANEKIQGINRNDETDNFDGIRTVYETHIMLNLADYPEGEGFDKEAKHDYVPYIITREADTDRIIAMYRNWEKDDDLQLRMDWFSQFIFLPWRGPKGIGLIHAIGSLSSAATGALRALLDSAMIQNMPTAIKLKGGRMSGQNIDLQPVGITEIDAGANVDDIRKVAMPLPFPGPSPTLFSLLGFVTDAAKGVVRTSMDDVAETNANVPVGTTMARIEQGMKVYSSIFTRLHRSQKKLIDIVCRLDRQYLEVEKTDDNELPEDIVRPEDFQKPMDVVPVSDPNIYSDAQRIGQAQAVLQMASTAPPGLYDLRAVNKNMLQAMKVPNIDEILPKPLNEQDENPVTENVKIGMGQGAFALPDQDHMAHMKVHLDWYKIFGTNPMFQQSVPNMLAHIKQHVLLMYASAMEAIASKEIGSPVADLLHGRAGKSPKLLNDLSRLLAFASNDITPLMANLTQEIQQPVQMMLQQVQAMTPPPPMDPTQAIVDTKKMEVQADQQKAQQEAQNDQQANAIKVQQIQADQQKAVMDDQVELQKNQEDNQTAMDIASMRVVTGHGTGGLTDGGGIDPH